MNMFLLLAFLGMASLLVLGSVVVYRSSKNRSKYGMNLGDLRCPRCSESADKIRKPANFKQVLWGGFTCDSCGIEVDKWGVENKEKIVP